MSENKKTVKIEKLAYRGNGVGRSEGKVVFVPATAPGDEVLVKIIRDKERFSEAIPLKLLHAADSRRAPSCPLSPDVTKGPLNLNKVCVGCTYQHISYDEEVKNKQLQLAFFLNGIPGFSQSILLEPVPSPSELGYRNKMSLHYSFGGEGLVMGYRANDNRSIINLDTCPLVHDEINNDLPSVKSSLLTQIRSGEEGKITLRRTEKDGVVSFRKNPEERKRILIEKTHVGEIKVYADGFFQVNPALAEIMIKYITGLLEGTGRDSLVDLYCGVGIFAIAGAKAGFRRIIGIDINREAISLATGNASEQACENCTFFDLPAADGLKKTASLIDYSESVLIVDPPRKGIEYPALELIMKLKPAVIIYVSCGPDTLARDLKKLIAAGYKIRSSRMFDMFPRTFHFESVTLLELNG